LQVNSMQLLLNQAPMSASLLLCMVPFLDTPPTSTALSPSLYIAIFAVSTSFSLPLPFHSTKALIANLLCRVVYLLVSSMCRNSL
jgi:hypothetical protein